MPRRDPQPNRLFWQAREGLNLSRSQLADDANREPVMRTCQHAPMDENFIGRRPGAPCDGHADSSAVAVRVVTGA